MGWNLDAIPLSTSEDVKSTIASIVQVLSTHQSSNSRLFIVLCKLLSILCLIIVEVKQIIGGASLILLSCIEVINLSLEDGILLCLHLLHVFKPLDLAIESFFSTGVMSLLHLLELCISHFLISDCEILVESVLFCSDGIVS